MSFARWLLDASVLATYGGCQIALLGYSVHRWQMLGRSPRPAPLPPPFWRSGDEPRVLVQLPVCDEPAVVERLVAAAAALDWPGGSLEIQLLDDSGPEGAMLGAAAVNRARATGAIVQHVRRPSRLGFKAG